MPVVFEEIDVYLRGVRLLPSKDVSWCTAVETQVVVGLDACALLNVLSQEGGPIVRWNNDGTIHVACDLSDIDSGGVGHHANKIL